MTSWNIESYAAWLSPSQPRHDRDVNDIYEINQSTGLLGYGSFGQVIQATSKVTGADCAIKQIAKSPTRDDDKAHAIQLKDAKAVRQEIYIMQKLSHRNIVKLLDDFEDAHKFYLVMELCVGGKVTDFIARTQVCSESDVAVIMRQVFEAVDYMHSKDIVHRDVKTENMLLASSCPISKNTLKLADYGVSCKCDPDKELKLRVGTPEYMSPQVVDGRYNWKADIWSCGVAMYVLLCGYVPFTGQGDSAIVAAVKRGNFTFPEKDWQTISEDAKHLLRSLLKYDARDRCTARQAKEHCWIVDAPGCQCRQLESALWHFRVRSPKRHRGQGNADALSDIRAAWNEVTEWANSLFPQVMPNCKAMPRQQLVVM
jgi:calcium-dependent protein kinase